MPVTLPLLCSREDVESVWSLEGVNTRIDDNDDGVIDVTPNPPALADEESYLTDAIEDASDEMYIYLQAHYDADELAASRWVNRRCAYIAAHLLSIRKGNGPQYTDKVEQIMAMLQEIHHGVKFIPGASKNHTSLPGVSNVMVDMGYMRAKLRAVRSITTGDRRPTRHWEDRDYGTGHRNGFSRGFSTGFA